MTHPFHVAQYNVARIRAELDDPVMHGFVSKLDYINGLADRAPGFVWRHQTEEGNSTAVRPYPDRHLLFTLSVWDSVEALYEFVYKHQHADMLRARHDWFLPVEEPYIVLWWLPAGEIPSVEEGMERLESLRRNGPAPDAFSFKERFPPPGVTPGADGVWEAPSAG